MAEFKFKIGDLVVFKAGIADSMQSCKAGRHAQPNHFMVVQRLSQECPGGTQLSYDLPGLGRMANEIELASPDEFDLVAATKLASEVEAQLWRAKMADRTASRKEEKTNG